MKFLNKQQSNIPTLIDDDNNDLASSKLDKANLLNQFFAKCFNPVGCLSSAGCCHNNLENSSCFDDILCDESQIMDLLLDLNMSKSSGPDGISSRMLKHTAGSIAPSVNMLFNLSILSGRLPDSWSLPPLFQFLSHHLSDTLLVHTGLFPC